jgi:hypothetical protein
VGRKAEDERNMNCAARRRLITSALALALPVNGALAQTGQAMPDPNKVAPQYRAAALADVAAIALATWVVIKRWWRLNRR